MNRQKGRHNSYPAEMADMWQFARERDLAVSLRALHHPRLGLALLAVAGDWLLIILATALVCSYGWMMSPLAVLLIGNRQRALGNILHDSSHGCFDTNRKRGRILANALLCWPLWVSMKIYREEHFRHHRFLADPKRDPDFIHDESRLSSSWLSVWLDQVFSLAMFRASLLAHLPRLDTLSILGVVGWWGAVLSAITLLFSATEAVIFLALWVVARATSFHVITSFREISDHVGLRPGTLIGFSRNHPIDGSLAQLFHPHSNGYHLLHHLAPGIPFHALPAAHELLLQWPPYAQGEQCDSYFSGKNSAVKSWVKRWR